MSNLHLKSQSFKVAVILVNYNCQRYLSDLFTSLAQLDYPQNRADIFFVDNGSSDDSFAWAKANASKLKYQVYFIENKKNLGFAGGNNMAIRQTLESKKYKHIVLLNIDTRVDKGWLYELVKAAESDEQIGAVQSLILLHSQPQLINTAGNKLHYLGFGWTPGSEPLRGSEPGYASGAAVLYRTQVLRQVGLFDEKFFMYHEDLELSWRIRLAGFKIVLAPQSIVYHKYQFSRHKKKWFWTERNRLLTYFSLYKLRTLILFAPVFIFTELGILAYSLIDGWFWHKARSYWEVLASIPYIIKKRRQIALLRQVSDKQILQQMTSKLDFPNIKNQAIAYIINPILQWYFKIILRIY